MHVCNSSSEAVQTGGSLQGLCREIGEFQLQWGALAHHTRGREIRKIYFVNFRPLHAYTHMHTDMQTNTQTHRIIHTSNSPCLLLRDIDLRAWEGTRGATGEMNNLTGYVVSEKRRKPPQFPCPDLFVLPQAVVGQRCSLLGVGHDWIHTQLPVAPQMGHCRMESPHNPSRLMVTAAWGVGEVGRGGICQSYFLIHS